MLLHLGQGRVIHGMHHEQDMRNYGGLRKKLPMTYYAMLIGTLAITGVGIPLTTIGFAGFVSKDAIIESAFAAGTTYAFWILVIAALMTSFYSWRLNVHDLLRHPRAATSIRMSTRMKARLSCWCRWRCWRWGPFCRASCSTGHSSARPRRCANISARRSSWPKKTT